jgi:hypothetical protein
MPVKVGCVGRSFQFGRKSIRKAVAFKGDPATD